MSSRSGVLLLCFLGYPCMTTACSAAYGDCLNSTCCVNGNFGCYRSTRVKYAQCKPLPESGICASLEGWQCPGWESCTAKYGDCYTSKCCKDTNFGCFKRPGKSYAQCRPKLSGACTDTAEWRCPGWELCTDKYESCTHTHCCADESFTCYRKHNAYAQCMPTGSCDPEKDGDCEPLASSLGQCSKAYQDCHLSACCQRGEDHCFLKTEGWGMCMPHCDTTSNPGWQCTKRELPSEDTKETCDRLRERSNLQMQLCGVLTDAAKCVSSFDTATGSYRPCRWLRESLSCEPSGQRLDCDCALYHRGCRQHAELAAQPTVEPSNNSFSEGIVALMLAASLIVCTGSCGLCWLGYRMRVHARGALANGIAVANAADEQDEDLARTTQARRLRAQKKYARADDAAIERINDSVSL